MTRQRLLEVIPLDPAPKRASKPQPMTLEAQSTKIRQLLDGPKLNPSQRMRARKLLEEVEGSIALRDLPARLDRLRDDLACAGGLTKERLSAITALRQERDHGTIGRALARLDLALLDARHEMVLASQTR